MLIQTDVLLFMSDFYPHSKGCAASEAEKLEEEISYLEMANALKSMKYNKTPGLDGFTVELF